MISAAASNDADGRSTTILTVVHPVGEDGRFFLAVTKYGHGDRADQEYDEDDGQHPASDDTGMVDGGGKRGLGVEDVHDGLHCEGVLGRGMAADVQGVLVCGILHVSARRL